MSELSKLTRAAFLLRVYENVAAVTDREGFAGATRRQLAVARLGGFPLNIQICFGSVLDCFRLGFTRERSLEFINANERVQQHRTQTAVKSSAFTFTQNINTLMYDRSLDTFGHNAGL